MGPADGRFMNTRCLVPLLLAPFLVGTLFAQSVQKSVPRPESFEWDHQMALFDEAFNNQNFVEAERYRRRSLEIVDQLQWGDGERASSLSSTAQALRHQKKFAESEPLFRQRSCGRKSFPRIIPEPPARSRVWRFPWSDCSAWTKPDPTT